MDLVRTQATFNDGVLYAKGILDSHYATNLGWTLDDAVVETYEYINGVGQFVPVIPETGEIDTTNPIEVIVNLNNLQNKLVRIKYYINMNDNPYILCGFEQDPDSSTTIIQNNYLVDLYQFYNKVVSYVSELENSCCEVPKYLTDTILKYFLLKSSLTTKNINVIIPIYLDLYYATQNTTPSLTLHSNFNHSNTGCNCHG